MEKIIGLFDLKNIKGGLKTTIFGALLCAFSGYGMYEVGFEDLTYDSVFVVFFLVGTGFLFLKDKKEDKS